MAANQDIQVYTRPRLGPVELAVLLLRALPLMLVIFLLLSALGIFAAFQLEKEYTATTRVRVALSEEYIYRPRVGDPLQNAAPQIEALTATEIELMVSPIVLEAVMDEFGLKRLYPKAAEALVKAPPEEQYEKSRAGLLALQKNFSAYAPPKQPVIQVKFTHRDPTLAADVLNSIMDNYLIYRADIFKDQSISPLGEQRGQFEQELAQAEQNIRQFLTVNRISDFETERASTRALFESVEAAVFTNRTRQSEADGQVALLRQQLMTTQPQIDISVEDTTDQSIIALELEREDLLTRYTPQSQVIQDINRRIARTREYVSDRNRPVGTVMRGPNPLFQSIETRLSETSAEAASLRLQGFELERQSEQIKERQRRLTELEPRWQELIRKRSLLETNLLNFATREAEARSLAEISGQGSDNIRVLERARRPAKGEDLKIFVILGSILFAGFCALLAGLAYALTRKGFATPGSLERTTGLPVVSMVKRY